MKLALALAALLGMVTCGGGGSNFGIFQDDLWGDDNKIQGDNNEVSGLENMLRGFNNRLIGDKNKIKGNNNLNLGVRSNVAGNNNWITGNWHNFKGNNIKMFGPDAHPFFVKGGNSNLLPTTFQG